jgi:hypothetical protein
MALKDRLQAERRVILLGASNIALGLRTVVDTAFRSWGRPLSILAAYGHGRSYGTQRTLLWWGLPGIVECGLWRALDQQEPLPTAALVTDIGNDLFYETPVDEILGWVEVCLDRLKRVDATTVLTPLPLCCIPNVSKAKYMLLRSLLYPASRLTLASAMARAFELDDRLRALAKERHISVAEPRLEWYGFDNIHIRRRCRATAWSEILAAWSATARRERGPSANGIRLRLRHLAPERRWLWGKERYTSQPSARLPDGTTLALY